MAINVKLMAEIELLRNGRKSKTSHTPPSHDIGRSNENSLRKKSDRPTGGQKGHEGHTLEMKATPDEVVDHIPLYCHNCANDLGEVEASMVGHRQEVIIPPIEAKYVEHRSWQKICPQCEAKCPGNFPAHITAPVQYGPNVMALVSYLSVSQYIPHRRIAAMINDLFSIPISEGSVDNLLDKMADKALPMYQTIQQKIQESDVVGSDETGAPVAGKKGWFHTWQNTALTFIVASLSRGYQTIATYFPDGFPISVYVSDCWAAQLKVVALVHQICIAHLLRELANFEEALSCTWSIEMKQVLLDAIEIKKQLTESQYQNAPIEVLKIHARLNELLQADSTAYHPKVKAFIKRLTKNQKAILTFLHHPKVPPDNNGSERAIRNIKVKVKVSGQYRSLRGAERFAIIRSVIDTTIKNTQNIFPALTLLANFVPE